MPRKRYSRIWLMPSTQFKEIVARSHTLTEILSHFGYRNIGSNNRTLKQRILEEGVDYSHIHSGRNNAGTYRKPKTLEECMETVFVTGKSGGKNSVRKYLRMYNLKEQRCRDCGLTDQWNGKPLTLQLEHINGDSTDDRLDNLCWLCANCHSQTSTYTGRANRGRRGAKLFALSLTPKNKTTGVKPRQGPHGPRPQCYKVPHPSKDELQARVWEKPVRMLAKEYGVSSQNTIKDWCQQLGVQMPPIGYWQRIASGWSHEQALKPWPKGIQQAPKFNETQIRDIRGRLANGERVAHLARIYECSHKTMRDIRDRKHYTHVLDTSG